MADEPDLELFFAWGSFCSQKAAIALELKGLKYKQRLMHLHDGETYEPWFMRINPAGQVPVLRHGEKYIPDSNAIVAYLDEHFGAPKLIPTESSEEGKIVQHFLEKFKPIVVVRLTYGPMIHRELAQNMRVPGFIQRHLISFAHYESRDKLFLKYIEENPDLTEVYKNKMQGGTYEFPDLSRDLVVSEIERTRDFLKEVESQLEKNKPNNKDDTIWLVGSFPTIIDITMAILLDRLHLVGLSGQLFEYGHMPHVEKYFQSLMKWEEFKTINSRMPSIGWMLVKDLMLKAAKLGSIVGAVGVAYFVYKKFKS